MRKIILFPFFILCAFLSNANTIIVKNAEELKVANAAAKPGDQIILQNGEWSNITIKLNCNGTKESPITFKAQTAGQVIITGNSKLLIGGNYIIVDGLYFTKGYAGDDAIIKFRVNNNALANNCRVTNTVIKSFNNPKRLDENYWVQLYGKNNRIDHCSFFDKKNMGVLMAVILDDERSRENFHSIDHNYFGFRLPLASNTGEMLRVGVSQHCQFNSNTQIVDNFFEHCDGETEIVSIKSGGNVIRNNLFEECQGAVVCRHGDNNTVENNVFIGNDKEGSGGIRVINKGQWVVNNLFYKCRGTSFRSPLSIMNGVPNSVPNRYVSAGDAVIANNSFFECTPVTFCEGSDEERSEAPDNIHILNNIFYNTKDSFIYKVYDDIKGFSFAGNSTNSFMPARLRGFNKINLAVENISKISIPTANAQNTISDSLQKISQHRLSHQLSSIPGFSDMKLLKKIQTNAYTDCGAKWFDKTNLQKQKTSVNVNCKNSQEIQAAINNNSNSNLTINLTGSKYYFESPLLITTDIHLTTASKKKIKFITTKDKSEFLINIIAGNDLSITNLNLDLKAVSANSFISTDTSGSSSHSNITFTNNSISNLKSVFLNASKTSVADSIIITNCNFRKNNGTLLKFNYEDDKKGYYNVEKLVFNNNTIKKHIGQLLTMLRSGNDESTMGPDVIFLNNKIYKSSTINNDALIHHYGTQSTQTINNQFISCNKGKTLFLFEDIVRARHQVTNNRFKKSGEFVTDEFVEYEANMIK